MKKVICCLSFIMFCLVAKAQQQDSSKIVYNPMLYEIRLNPKDTAFRNTKFLLPPVGFISDNNVPMKTNVEVDSITSYINKMQLQIINRNQKLISK